MAHLVLVSGATGSGKSTIADEIARDLGATVAGFDWLMSGLRPDTEIVRARIEHRTRSIPDWYELTWERVAASHRNYERLTGAKIVVDAIAPLADNLELVRAHLRQA